MPIARLLARWTTGSRCWSIWLPTSVLGPLCSLVRPIRTPCAPLSTRLLRVSVNVSPPAALPFLEPSDEVRGGWHREDVWRAVPTRDRSPSLLLFKQKECWYDTAHRE